MKPASTAALPAHILIIGPAPNINTRIAEHLRTAYGWQVETAPDIVAGVQLLEQKVFNAIVLDDYDNGASQEPCVDNIEFMRERSELPLIVIGHKEGYTHVSDSLDAGADDFVYHASPHYVEEVGIRLRAMLRYSHSGFTKAAEAVTDRLTITPPNCCIELDGRSIHFTHSEYKIFAMLFRRRSEIVSYHEITAMLGSRPSDNLVGIFVSRIRKKIDAAYHASKLGEQGMLQQEVGENVWGKTIIRTVCGRGYMMPAYDEIMNQPLAVPPGFIRGLQL